MNERAICEILESIGWLCAKDDAGDYYCTKSFDNVVVFIMPCVRRRNDHYRISFMPCVSTDHFSKVVSSIFGVDHGFTPIVSSNLPPVVLHQPSRDDIVKLSEAAIGWALDQNIEDGLARYRDLPTNSKGAMPLRHLAALALSHDVSALENYIKCFESGNRLGFVNYISIEMIERALRIAKSGEL